LIDKRLLKQYANKVTRVSKIEHTLKLKYASIGSLHGSTMHRSMENQMHNPQQAHNINEVSANEQSAKPEVKHRANTMVFSKAHPATAVDVLKLAKDSAVYLLNHRFLFDELTTDKEIGTRVWVYGKDGLRGYLVTQTFLGKIRRIVPKDRMRGYEEYLTAKPWQAHKELSDANLTI